MQCTHYQNMLYSGNNVHHMHSLKSFVPLFVRLTSCAIVCCLCLKQTHQHSPTSILVVLVVALVGRRIHDRRVAGSTPSPGAIKSTRSTQPSIPPG